MSSTRRVKGRCSVDVSIRLPLHLEPGVAIVNMERESPMLKSFCSYPGSRMSAREDFESTLVFS